MQKIVDFLHGKKGIIGGLISVISAYLVSKGIFTMDEGLLVAGVLSVLGISSDVATQKLGVSPEKLGKS